jgi:hypothetical protein
MSKFAKSKEESWNYFLTKNILNQLLIVDCFLKTEFEKNELKFEQNGYSINSNNILVRCFFFLI